MRPPDARVRRNGALRFIDAGPPNERIRRDGATQCRECGHIRGGSLSVGSVAAVVTFVAGLLSLALLAMGALGCAAPYDYRATPCADQVCRDYSPDDPRLDRCLVRCARRP